MARLPIPGSDKGTWGDVLNDYLSQTLNADGTLKSGVVTATKLDAASQANLTKASTSVQIGGDLSGSTTAPTVSKIQGNAVAAGTPSNGQVLVYNTGSWAPGTVASTTVSDATSSVKGIVQLAGDLAGTAASPTVPGLAAKAPLASPTFTGTVTVPGPTNSTDAATKGYVDTAVTAKAPLASPTFTGTVTVPGPTNNTDAATKGYVDSAITSGTGNSAIALTAIALQTASFTASVNTIVPVDATSAAITVTLPTAPANKSRITVKKIDASANVVTIATGGSDVINKAGGSTSMSLQVSSQAVSFQYASTGAIWYVVSDDIPSAWVSLGVAKTVSTTYTLVNTDHVILADATSAAFTVTLPTAVGYFGRFTIAGISTGNNVVTVATTASQTISGAATVTVGTQASGAAYSSVDLISDGANWRIV